MTVARTLETEGVGKDQLGVFRHVHAHSPGDDPNDAKALIGESRVRRFELHVHGRAYSHPRAEGIAGLK